MKKPLPLMRPLRLFFGFLRGLTILVLVVRVLAFVFDWNYLRRPSRIAAEIEFSPPSVSLRPEAAPQVQAGLGIELRSLRGSLAVRREGESRRLISATRVPVFVASLVRDLFALAMLHCLWRLCQAGERGDVFSPANPGYVRRLGLVSLAFPFAGIAVDAWERVSIARYLDGQVSFEGLQLLPGALARSWWEQVAASYSGGYGFDWDSFCTGLLALALAEVFRRGLALKQENDLTV